MKLLYLLLFASFGGHAAERYVVGQDLLLTMDAYARASNRQPLNAEGKEELRIWTRDFMGGHVEGHLISTAGASTCRADSHYKDGVVTIHRARCRPWRRGEDALRSLDDLSALDQREWDCPLFDGYEVFVEGIRGGKRFVLRVGNPAACDDPGSKAVVNLLDKLG